MLSLLAVACGGEAPGTGDTSVADATAPAPCAYPDGVVDPMTLDAVIPPFIWPKARSLRDGTTTSLDLMGAHCNAAEDIDWSPFDVLLFVSVPAW